MCTTLTSSYLPPKEQYTTDITPVRPGVSDISDKPSIYHNFFNNSRNRPYSHDDPILLCQRSLYILLVKILLLLLMLLLLKLFLLLLLLMLFETSSDTHVFSNG